MSITKKMCPVCEKGCDPHPTVSNPEASEYYCPRCHKSYPMPLGEAKEWYQILGPAMK